MEGGFDFSGAHAAMDHAEASAKQRKVEALAAAGIDAADAPPVLTDSQLAEQQRQRAERLRADLERVHAFQRDELRDVAALPGWFRSAIETDAVDLYSEAKNCLLLPA